MSATDYPTLQISHLARGTFCTPDQELYLRLLCHYGRASVLVVGDHYAGEVLLAALANGITRVPHGACIAIGDGTLSDLSPMMHNMDSTVETNSDYSMWDYAFRARAEVLIAHDMRDEDLDNSLRWIHGNGGQCLMHVVAADVAAAREVLREALAAQGNPHDGDPLALFDAVVTVGARSKTHEWGSVEKIEFPQVQNGG